MAEEMLREYADYSDSLFVHFDVSDHYLKLDTFIQTADSARRIVAALDRKVFKGSLRYEFLVLPPDEGSFLQRLAVAVTAVAGGAAAFIMFLDSDTPKEFVKGLTGKAPSEWSLEFGEALKDVLADDQPGDPEAAKIELKVIDEEAICRTSEQLMTALTRGILEGDTAKVEKFLRDDDVLFEALDARADFYAACFNDKDVKRIGFDPGDDFPIPRSSFPGRALKPTRKETEEEPPEWLVVTENVYVNSPNWDKDDQYSRKWKGKDSIGRTCYFVIEDAEFWQLADRKSLHVEGIDNFGVQWACRIVDGKPRDRRVLRVLELNGQKLATPLQPDAINAILGRFLHGPPPWTHPSLFDDLEEEE